MEYKNHYYSLDLFRGFCGYGVAICHLNAFAYQNQFLEYVSFIFVEFFFVLSGFVLYPQLLKVYNDKNNLKVFYLRRWKPYIVESMWSTSCMSFVGATSSGMYRGVGGAAYFCWAVRCISRLSGVAVLTLKVAGAAG